MTACGAGCSVWAQKSPSWREESRKTMTGKAGKEQSRKPAKSYDAAPIHQRRGGGRIDHGRRNAPFVRAHTIRNIGRFSSEKKGLAGQSSQQVKAVFGAFLACLASPRPAETAAGRHPMMLCALARRDGYHSAGLRPVKGAMDFFRGRGCKSSGGLYIILVAITAI